MMYDRIDNLDTMLGGLTAWQGAISNNIANMHTPGYVRQTVNFSDYLNVGNNPFQTQLAQKMGSIGTAGFTDEDSQPVNLEQEMVDMQKVYMNYSMVSRVVSSEFSNLRRASQVGR